MSGEGEGRIGGSRDLAAVEPEKLDPAVAATLFSEHERELRLLLMGVLRDPHRVADVLQTTAMRVLDSGHQSDPASRKGWLFRVAMNEALLLKRKARRESEVLGSPSLHERAACLSESPEEAAIRSDLAEKVASLMSRLPEELRDVVQSRIRDGKSFQQTADELQIPLGTALTRMRTALNRLQDGLKGEFP